MFALTKEEAEKDNATVVVGTIILNGLSAFALFDSGATHSFVSSQFASKLTRKLLVWIVDYVLLHLLV